MIPAIDYNRMKRIYKEPKVTDDINIGNKICIFVIVLFCIYLFKRHKDVKTNDEYRQL